VFLKAHAKMETIEIKKVTGLKFSQAIKDFLELVLKSKRDSVVGSPTMRKSS